MAENRQLVLSVGDNLLRIHETRNKLKSLNNKWISSQEEQLKCEKEKKQCELTMFWSEVITLITNKALEEVDTSQSVIKMFITVDLEGRTISYHWENDHTAIRRVFKWECAPELLIDITNPPIKECGMVRKEKRKFNPKYSNCEELEKIEFQIWFPL
ncbi:MAG: hypothetical protein HFJ28_03430 [Clostridia bacterium]|jgi:hypothetical protein|nr:hypothetical protein [Clostridia bacterium]